MELVSIVVPVYNVEEYLHQCVDSILAQSYSNIEVLLVDDGSTDRSGAICDEYALVDSRVKAIHQKNSGVSAARNAGIAQSTGDFIGFVDSDDHIEFNMYERLMDLCTYFNADFCFSNRTKNQGQPENRKVIVLNNKQAQNRYNTFQFEGDDHIPNSIWGGGNLF